jgi:hypothetical protein
MTPCKNTYQEYLTLEHHILFYEPTEEVADRDKAISLYEHGGLFGPSRSWKLVV